MDEFDHLFLHLSDIHFRRANLGRAYDLDTDLRRALESDAGEMSSNLGSPSAILVSGDIAFAGKKEQYHDAETWLDESLCLAVKGDPASVWSVPGNHDVDQSIIEPKPSYKDVREKLRACSLNQIDHLLTEHLKEPHIFYDAIEEYNEFAIRHECSTTVDAPVWDTGDKFPLSDGSVLRIFGLNSALISDSRDQFENGKMVLGQYQCLLDQNPRFVNVAMCHHPPDWLRDCDDVEQTLNPRCVIQLFGHKHKYKLRLLDNNLLQIAAGAVHPSRNENGWEPRYNWIALGVHLPDGQRTLSVKVYPRIWLSDQQKFSADRNKCDDGQDYAAYSIPLPDYESIVDTAPREDVNSTDVVTHVSEVTNQSEEICDSRGNPVMDAERALARRYFQLGYVQKMKVAINLSLLSDNDDSLTDHQRQRTHLKRAKELGILPKLWEAVESGHGDGRYPTNPFN